MAQASDTEQEAFAALFKRVWILSDGKKGDLVQCEGVADALEVKAQTRIVSPSRPWEWLMPWGPVPPQDRIGQKGSPLSPPLPDLVLAAGWRTLAYVRAIKRRQRHRVFTVFLKNPRCKAPYIDLVWAPAHDRLQGGNVITSLASPHRYSPGVLARDHGVKPDYLQTLSVPLVAVLLGGESKDYHFSQADCMRLAQSLSDLAAAGAGLAITPSRRSSSLLIDILRQKLEGQNIYWWDGQTPNPYGSLLAHCDQFIVTADSANMIGEACVSGRPVWVFRPSGGSRKFDRLLEGFVEHGAVRLLPDRIGELPDWRYEPLFAATDIAREIEKRAECLMASHQTGEEGISRRTG